jgi:serine/threonine protein kinase
VCLKLLLDAARGLAYMHDVDVVHGDVKSRNLLVFWEEEEEEEEAGGQGQQGGGQEQAPAADGGGRREGAAAAGAPAAAAAAGAPAAARSRSPRPLVWGLKWCDFGVSFRAAEAPGGVMKTVSAIE